MRKFVFSLMCSIISISAWATDPAPAPQKYACIEEFLNSQDFLSKIDGILNGRELNQEAVEVEKTKFYTLLANEVNTHCLVERHLNDFNTKISKTPTLQMQFQKSGKYYRINVPTDTLFDYLTIPTAVVIAPLKNKNPGDKISRAEMPKSFFFTTACSDHEVSAQISNSSPVNVAGQGAFTPYAHREFFIDFPDSKLTRAFPGVLIAATTGLFGKEEVVWYSNYKRGRDAAVAFATALQNGPCSNQNLSVYVVKLDHELSRQDNTWPAWARDVLGFTTLAIPLMIKSKELEHLESVVIMDGPYLIK